MPVKHFSWKEELLLFSFPLFVLPYDVIRVILYKFPLKLFIQTALYYLLIATILTCIFIFARSILVKISKVDIIFAWPVLFIIFLRLSVNKALPILENSVLPVASALIISVMLIMLTNKEKISSVRYAYYYNFCVFFIFLIFIRCNLFVFLLIMFAPLILLIKKSTLGRVSILILGSTCLIFGLILVVLPFYSKTPYIQTINKISKAHKNNNVILIIIDTARKDCIDLESKGTITPSLKQLAEDGVVLKKFIANGAWTPPTHASLFTGLLPSDHGVFHYKKNDQGFTILSDKLSTLAEILHKNGINTGGFFSNPLVKEEFGFGQGFKQYSFVPPDIVSITNFVVVRDLEILLGYFPKYFAKYKHLTHNRNKIALSDKVLEKALKWVISDEAKQNFFLFINLMEQHYIRYFYDPIEGKLRIGPNDYWESLEQLYLEPESMKDKNKELLEWHKLTIKNVDYYLGKMIEILKDKRLYENTTIVVTADHGHLFGEWAHYGHKDNIYAPNIFVPFIIKYADSFSERKINSNRIFQQVDVFAEILDLFDISIPPYVYGKPFSQKNGNLVITQLYPMKNIPNSLKNILDKDLCGTYLNIGDDYYQLIYSTDGKHEMYYIHDFNYNDTNNLYEEFRESSMVLKFINKCPEILYRRIYEDKPVNNEDILRRLKSLGYIN